MKKFSILIVDDEEQIAKIIKAYLSLYRGFDKIIIAEDGVQAMQKISNQDFDLIVTDLVMPKRNGFALIETIRKIPKYYNMKIMIVSGCMNKEAAVLAVQKGVRHVVVKPFTATQILSKAFEALKISKFPEIKAREIVEKTILILKGNDPN